MINDHSGLPAALIGGLIDNPVLHTIHGPLDGEGGVIYEQIARVAPKIGFISISMNQRKPKPHFPWVANCPNALDFSLYPVKPHRGDYLFFLGRMSPDKGCHRAIDVAVTAGLPLKIAGKNREPLERQYFDEFVAPYLSDQIQYMGEVTHGEKVELLQNARATLFPIEWEEPFGLVMIESMACGTPVIATRWGAVPEVIEHGAERNHRRRLQEHGGGDRGGGPARPAGARPLRAGTVLARADGRRLPARLPVGCRPLILERVHNPEMECATCGQANPDIARFCLACGSPLSAIDQRPEEERRVVSVLFVDLVGFTARAEKLDPEDVRAILAPYHACVRREIESFSGVVEKFIGDAVMAVFGAPTAFGDDAERAMRAALAVRDAVREMNERDEHLDLQLRIAVNTGEALVSLNSRPELGESMIAGDVVNTAARLQAAAPVNGILVGEETHAATQGAIDYEPAAAGRRQGEGASRWPRGWRCVRRRPAGERRLSVLPLVGRARELETLRWIWQRTIEERQPHLVTVLGQAGVGKTRLAVEFAVIAAELGGRTVRGRSLPYRDSSAYGAFAAQLKQLTGIFESDSLDVALAKLGKAAEAAVGDEWEKVARHLSIVLGLDPSESVPDRETLYFSIRGFLEAVAARASRSCSCSRTSTGATPACSTSSRC